MMSFLKEIAVSVLSSTVVMGIFVFALKKIISDLISLEFEKRTKLRNHRLEKSFKYDDQFTETEMGVYPEILEMTNRLKNITQDAVKQDLAYKWSGDFRPLTALLTEKLLKYRLILPEDLFQNLHQFKHLCQDLLLQYDILTRDEYEFDKEFYQKQLSSMKEISGQLEIIFGVIEEQMRRKMKALRDA